jgi:multidrug efflux pump
MSLIDASLNRSRTVIATLVLLLIAGAFAFSSIPKESEPDINVPYIYTIVTLEGVSPEDGERLLIKPLEQEMRTIEGVKEMTAQAFEGGVSVTLEFEAGFDADQALTDVREAVDLAKPDLPDEAEEPEVHEVNLSLFPILVVTLSGDVPERTLLAVARRLQDDIEGIPSVLEANIAGDREEQIELVIDPTLLESYGINPADAVSAVSRSNRLIAAGTLDTGAGAFPIKVPGLYENVQDILDQPLKVSGDSVVRVRDVAQVRRGFKDPDSFARVNGERAIALEVSKRAGSNIIETIEQVRQVVDEAKGSWPTGLTVAYSQDKSSDIRTMLSDLQNNVLSAVLLVMIVIVGALGWRTGALVGIAIPGSFLTGILVLASFGLTMNIVVLFSLILATGMLVDGAIVVTEYADRKMAEGLDKKAAYGLAAKRMAWPIIASTATTLAAFAPLVFWPGVVGEFMKFLPITLLATLTASLLMALIFVPTLGGIFGKPGAVDPDTMKALAASETGNIRDIGGMTGRYVRVLSGALRHPGKIVALALISLIGVWLAYGALGKGVEFFPDVEPENAQLHVHARGNYSVWEKDALVREVEERILDMPEFHTIYARSGSLPRSNETTEDTIGIIQLEFTDWDTRRPASEILADVRARTADLAGIRVEPKEQEAGPPVGKPVTVQLSANDPALLEPAVVKLRNHFEQVDGLIEIEDSRAIPGIEWELTVNRAQAAKFGVDVTAVGDVVKLVTRGVKLGEYRPDDSDDEIDIVARYPMRYRTLEQLDHIRIPTEQGDIPIANFVKRSAQQKTGTLERTDGRRQMSVKADVADGVLAADKVAEIQQWLATEAHLDPRIHVEFKGEDEEQKAASAFLGKAFLVALFIMAIILVTQFNSFYAAGLILFAVVMSTVGVLLGLLVTDQPFGIVMNGIGVIALAGIVVNNNIVLIDTYDRLKLEMPPFEAILRTGAQRLRPVMLTTITTVLGLMPMVLKTNIDFVNRTVSIGAPSTQWWAQLATSIVFGLTFATILTLVVTPCALMLQANLAGWRARRRERRAQKRAAKAGGREQPAE